MPPQQPPETPEQYFKRMGLAPPVATTVQPSRVGIWNDKPRSEKAAQSTEDFNTGVFQGMGKSVWGAAELGYTLSLGDLATYIANLATGANVDPRQMMNDLRAHPALQATNADQQHGQTFERIGEFALLPSGKGSLLTRAVIQATGNAGLTAAHGGDVRTIGDAAALGAVVPIVGAGLAATGRGIADTAVPFVRSALKPTVAATKKEVGVGMAGLNATATRIAKFIIDRRMMSYGDAQRLVRSAEFEVRKAVAAAGNPITDAAQQAETFLQTLLGKVKKADKPELEAIVQGEIDDLYRVNGQMSKSVPVIDPKTGLQAVDKNGIPLTTQELRTDISTEEARDLAKASSKYVTGDTWGEAGRTMHQRASKAKESGIRRSVRDAVPAAASPLAEESRAISAREQLDRMGFRQGNTNIVDLPSVIMAAPKVAGGHLPLLSVAMTWLRRNKLRVGVMADELGKAIQSQDVKTTAEILTKLGAGAEIQRELNALPKPVASHALSVLGSVDSGRHTLSDGTVWDKLADGTVVQVK